MKITPDAPSDKLATAPTTPLSNDTIASQLAHRSIRSFQDTPLSQDELDTLLTVARHGATSSFLQRCTIVRVQDPEIRHKVYQSSGQPYVDGSRGELFVFVVDLYRNSLIRQQAGASLEPLERTAVFVQGFQDTMIAAQNMVVAAESLGLGTVYLGSVTNDPKLVIEALKLPKYTFPIVGLLVGHANQEPQFKPRLPEKLTTSTDQYPRLGTLVQEFTDYDQRVAEYYDLRNANQRVDNFSQQIANNLGKGAFAERDMLAALREQGLCLK